MRKSRDVADAGADLGQLLLVKQSLQATVRCQHLLLALVVSIYY
jgi:hypothetical protein